MCDCDYVLVLCLCVDVKPSLVGVSGSFDDETEDIFAVPIYTLRTGAKSDVDTGAVTGDVTTGVEGKLTPFSSLLLYLTAFASLLPSSRITSSLLL